MRTMRTPALAVAAALALAACGGDAAASDVDLDGMQITVGSKNFTEQYVLSEIMLQALAAHGARVTDATDTGDTPATRAALESGEIDAYFGYNTTAYVELLGLGDVPPQEGEEITEAVREADQGNGIAWLGRSSFNNTYGFAVSEQLAEGTQATRYSIDAFDLDSLAEFLEENPDLTVCVEQEFPDRDDGLVLFEEATGFTIPDEQLEVLADQEAVYAGFQDGTCDVGEVFTTDGQVEDLGLGLVVDNGVFYVYNVSFVVREDVAGESSDDLELLTQAVLGPMSQSRMTELNQRVDGGEPVSDVAQDYLEQFDLL